MFKGPNNRAVTRGEASGRRKREERVRRVRLEPGGLSAAEKWIGERRSMWERKLDRLAAILDAQGKE